MKRILAIVSICLFWCLSVKAQKQHQGILIENISKLKESNVNFETIQLFQETSNPRLSRKLQKDVKAHKLLTISAAALEQIQKSEAQFFTLSVPLPDGTFAQLNLIESSHLMGDYKVRTSSGKPYKSILNTMTILRGEVDYNGVKGIAAFTISEKEVSGMFSLPHLGNFSLGKLENESTHIVYQDSAIVAMPDFICEVEESQSPEDTHKNENATPKAYEPDCLGVYIEAGFELFTNRGSVANSEAYIINLFNQVAVLYQNENIPIDISEIFVWDTSDPYADSDSADTLSDFRSELDDNYVGNMAHLVDMDPGGNGGRARRRQLCDKDDAHAYSDVHSFIGTVPNYSWSVSVFAHEMGHTIGSRHTHDCAWGPNGNQQIDDCGSTYWTDPDCFNPSNPILPAAGGTIMSYCHLGPEGINFSLGFGNEPGDLLRDEVNDANCLDGCFPCDVTDSANFEITPYCDNGTWKVNVTALDLDPQNHWWGLFQTDTQGEVGDAHTVDGPIGGIQSGPTAHWGWLDMSKRYYIKHGIWSDYCYNWRENRIPIEPFYVEPADFKFEDENDNEKEVFCVGEDIWADGNATVGENRYNIHAWKLVNGQKQWFGSIGWYYTQMNEVNISEEFASLDNPKYFTPGEYVLTIAFMNLDNCEVWTPVEKKFTVECCDDNWDANFFPAASAGSGNFYTITATNFETYDSHNVIHEWYLLKTNTNGGYTAVTSSVGGFNYTAAEFGEEYTLIHKLRTPCGEVCFSRTIHISKKSHIATALGDSPADTTRHEIDCSIIDNYFPCPLTAPQPSINCSSGEVSWTNVANVDGYVVRVYINQGECCKQPLTQPDITKYLSYTQNSYTIPNVEDVKCLTVQLGVRCGNTTIWGTPVCRTCCRIEGPPTNLNYNCNTYWATFDPVAGADQYVVEVTWNDSSADCFCFGGTQITHTWNIGDTNQVRILPSFDNENCFSFRIGAKCDGLSETIWSEKHCSYCFDIPLRSNEQEHENQEELQQVPDLLIMPNPASSQVEFRVATEKETSGEYIIRSFNGLVVERIHDSSQSTKVTVGKYPPGIYFVQFISKTGYKSEVKKLIIK